MADDEGADLSGDELAGGADPAAAAGGQQSRAGSCGPSGCYAYGGFDIDSCSEDDTPVEEFEEDEQEAADTTAQQAAADGRDLQGIPWERLQVSRERYRQQRLQQYRNYMNCIPEDQCAAVRAELTAGWPQPLAVTEPACRYHFVRNWRAVASSIVHFQLRNLLWASTAHDVYVVCDNRVQHWNSVMRCTSDVMDLRGLPKGPRIPGLGRVQVSTLCVAGELLAAGGFTGELVLGRLHRTEPLACWDDDDESDDADDEDSQHDNGQEQYQVEQGYDLQGAAAAAAEQFQGGEVPLWVPAGTSSTCSHHHAATQQYVCSWEQQQQQPQQQARLQLQQLQQSRQQNHAQRQPHGKQRRGWQYQQQMLQQHWPPTDRQQPPPQQQQPQGESRAVQLEPPYGHWQHPQHRQQQRQQQHEAAHEPVMAAAGTAAAELLHSCRVTQSENGITNGIEIFDSCSYGRGVMTSNNDCCVRLFDVEGCRPRQRLAFPFAVNYATLRPDGACLGGGPVVAVVGDDPVAWLVDCRSGLEVLKLEGHRDYSFAAAWHPAGQLLATGNQDSTTRVWDVRQTSAPLAVLAGSMGAIRSLRFSPDGQHLAAAEPADFVHVYDVASGFATCQEIDLFGEVAGISFSPDAQALFVAISDTLYSSLVQYKRARQAGS